MSAAARSLRAEDDLAIYARLHHEGRVEVIGMIRRRFPRSSESEVEDIVSAALVDMIRGRRLTHWSPGAIGLWYEMSRGRMLNHLRRPSLLGSVALAADEHPSREPSAQENLEALLSDWRVVEAVATLPERAATYVRLRLLAGQRKSEVLRGTGWTDRQYRYVQEEAKQALRSMLRGEDGPDSCQGYRDMIEAAAIGELALRKRIALRAHRERCAHCRAYDVEAKQTLQALAPLVGFAAAPLGAGSAVLASGLSLASKGAATLCLGALCLGGAYVIVKHEPAPPRPAAMTRAPAVAAVGSDRAVVTRPSGLRGKGGATASRPTRASDPLGLVGATSARQPRRRPSATAASAEAAFGLRVDVAPARRSIGPPAPQSARTTSCVPGDLGC